VVQVAMIRSIIKFGAFLEYDLYHMFWRYMKCDSSWRKSWSNRRWILFHVEMSGTLSASAYVRHTSSKQLGSKYKW